MERTRELLREASSRSRRGSPQLASWLGGEGRSMELLTEAISSLMRGTPLLASWLGGEERSRGATRCGPSCGCWLVLSL